ncbi:MAG: hypothetical protein ACRD22_03535 [Terriglobia bacterium]
MWLRTIRVVLLFSKPQCAEILHHGYYRTHTLQAIKVIDTNPVADSESLVAQINENHMENCGKAPNPDLAAAVYVDYYNAQLLQFKDNTYSGDKNNLKYFIWCVQKSPPAFLSGNTSNTLLPNRIGN